MSATQKREVGNVLAALSSPTPLKTRCQLVAPLLPGVIAAGTNLGNVALWRYSNPSSVEEDERCWRLQPPALVEGSIVHIMVGCSKTNFLSYVHLIQRRKSSVCRWEIPEISCRLSMIHTKSAVIQFKSPRD